MIKPIADRVAQNLEIISKKFHFSTRYTSILMGFIIYFGELIVNPMGRNLVRWKSLSNSLEILCHRFCNRLYFYDLSIPYSNITTLWLHILIFLESSDSIFWHSNLLTTNSDSTLFCLHIMTFLYSLRLLYSMKQEKVERQRESER